ncbi:MAG TPA: ABC transporter ATP-binding protein [Anaerolineae bacterium]|nr:ABC transporter ATP-binding protein [Anaerolineae bacterium]HQH39759.1 ABC transporter ATP-binding protein [Anaerolineae bacterium]
MHPKERAKDIRGTVNRLWGYLKRQKWALIAILVLVLISSGLGLLGPYLMGIAIDDYIMPGDLPGLGRIVLVMLGVYLATSVVSWMQVYIMASVAQRTVRDIRNDLFVKLQTLSLRFFDQRPHGELMSRLTNDVENINHVLNEGVTQLLSSLVSLIGVAAIMLIMNVRLALVSMLTMPLMMLLSNVIARYTRQGFREQQQYLGDLNSIIEETVTGQHVVKAYGREQAVIESFNTVNVKLRKAAAHAQIFAGVLGPLNNFVNNTGLAIVAGAGGWMAVQGMATVGTIAAFINYARQLAAPLNQIANLYNTIQAAIAGAERVFEILDETPELIDAPEAIPLEDIRGDVVFTDVCFGYQPDVPVLKHVSLHARRGQTIALVGPTGAGKTTIVNLLTRFYDIDSGSITVDSLDIRQLKMADLRRELGIVLQDTYLFATTVMENIRYGRLEATDDDVIAAAKFANADQFIHRLPGGYQTELSERAGNISQGQRQLLAIARAILADPSILILDEATSSVDTRTEKNIQEAMLRLMEGRTSFVIAHRLSTIRDADAILVIHNGEIIERGTHQALLAQRGFYYNMYMSQFKGQHEAMPELAAV